MKNIKKQILSNMTKRPLANNFERILRMSQKSLKRGLVEELKRLGYKDIEAPNGFVYAQGKIPVLLVAHLDTVHKKLVRTICYSRDGKIMMSPEGIGGDDRAGVYMILQIIQKHSCHVLFCEDEEIGGHGARDFANSKIRPKANYIVEMDRRGSNDAVFYHCANPEFVDFVCSFGFEEAIGSFSDISVIAPRLGIAAVNISAGYYNEHQKHEFIDLKVLEHNIARISEMVQRPSELFEYMEQQFNERLWQNSFEDMSLWDYIDRGQGKEESKKLMPLPDSTVLHINGQYLEEYGRYMFDAQGKVYKYISELDAAILSESTIASSRSGFPLKFRTEKARTVNIITLEIALELLQNG